MGNCVNEQLGLTLIQDVPRLDKSDLACLKEAVGGEPVCEVLLVEKVKESGLVHRTNQEETIRNNQVLLPDDLIIGVNGSHVPDQIRDILHEAELLDMVVFRPTEEDLASPTSEETAPAESLEERLRRAEERAAQAEKERDRLRSEQAKLGHVGHQAAQAAGSVEVVREPVKPPPRAAPVAPSPQRVAYSPAVPKAAVGARDLSAAARDPWQDQDPWQSAARAAGVYSTQAPTATARGVEVKATSPDQTAAEASSGNGCGSWFKATRNYSPRAPDTDGMLPLHPEPQLGYMGVRRGQRVYVVANSRTDGEAGCRFRAYVYAFTEGPSPEGGWVPETVLEPLS